VTYRFKGHVSVDPGTYRDPAEVQAALARRPAAARARAAAGAGPGRADDRRRRARGAQAEIDAALAAAERRALARARRRLRGHHDTGAGVAMNAPMSIRGERQHRGSRR
jgi:TPP-dependent pyruvate/acetoin dehydrogenase alpha subunit